MSARHLYFAPSPSSLVLFTSRRAVASLDFVRWQPPRKRSKTPRPEFSEVVIQTFNGDRRQLRATAKWPSSDHARPVFINWPPRRP
jgi:hypothetical protein